MIVETSVIPLIVSVAVFCIGMLFYNMKKNDAQ